ncbi:hypothetical protein GCM10007895_20810 [Paraferrimonas sedimenticola]|uniref:Outer membrane protein beta-barrel domain-containing protein n=2 Tax=Paraferrimonas sedimenticola TaxID=375674 RepID=A0AA37W0Z3_9GAMM|nr:hypothetical protein GCM10007895_20810 [Paraferrimonas sedimenticola]
MSTDAFKSNATSKDRRLEVGTRIGKYFGDLDQGRTYMTLRSASTGKQGQRLEGAAFLFSADYLTSVTDTGAVEWFVGPTLGGSRLSEDVPLGGGKSAKVYDSHFVFGGQTGFKFNYSRYFEFEGGYQYLRYTGDRNGIKLDADQRLQLVASFKF